MKVLNREAKRHTCCGAVANKATATATIIYAKHCRPRPESMLLRKLLDALTLDDGGAEKLENMQVRMTCIVKVMIWRLQVRQGAHVMDYSSKS